MSAPLSSSILLCELVLNEPTGRISLIRVIDVINTPPGVPAHFFSLTYLHSDLSDYLPHVLQVQVAKWEFDHWDVLAAAPPQPFLYGYKLDPSGPGAFALSTEFNLNVERLGGRGTVFVQALVDGQLVTQTPLMLRR